VESSVVTDLVPKNTLKSDVGSKNASISAENETLNQLELVPEKDRASFFEDIRQNLEKINQFIPIQSTNLVFEFDELGDPPVIKVVDKDSSEIIREIPPKEFSEMAKALDEFADKLNGSAMIFESIV
jgi:flagellar protein FlaG